MTAQRAAMIAGADLRFLQEIAIKAEEVRAAQIKYFRTRHGNDLTASKIAERELDQLLAGIGKPSRAEPDLFGRSGPREGMGR